MEWRNKDLVVRNLFVEGGIICQGDISSENLKGDITAFGALPEKKEDYEVLSSMVIEGNLLIHPDGAVIATRKISAYCPCSQKDFKGIVVKGQIKVLEE